NETPGQWLRVGGQDVPEISGLPALLAVILPSFSACNVFRRGIMTRPSRHTARVKRLIPALQLRPESLQVLLETTAEQDGPPLQSVRVLLGRNDFAGCEVGAVRAVLSAQHDNNFARVVARAPEKVRLVTADGLWQSVPRTEKIDCGGLAVIVAENRCFALLLRCQRVVGSGSGFHHFVPPELIGVVLRKGCCH